MCPHPPQCQQCIGFFPLLNEPAELVPGPADFFRVTLGDCSLDLPPLNSAFCADLMIIVNCSIFDSIAATLAIIGLAGALLLPATSFSTGGS